MRDDLHGFPVFSADESEYASLLDELDKDPLSFAKGLFNALGFVAVLYLFGWFMWNIVPRFIVEFMPWIIEQTGGH